MTSSTENNNIPNSRQPNNIFITSTGGHSGKSTVCAGIYQASVHIIKGPIAFFKPIGTYSDKGNKKVCIDKSVLHMRGLTNTKYTNEEICPICVDTASEMIIKGEKESLVADILDAYEKISANAEIVLIEGMDLTHIRSTLEFDINVDIANSLNADVLLVTEGNIPTEDIIRNILITRSIYVENECNFAGVIINKAVLKKAQRSLITKRLKDEGIMLYGFIPYTSLLSQPMISDFITPLKAQVLKGEKYLKNRATSLLTGAMHTNNFITHLKKTQNGTLILTPGDREDIFLPAILSRLSSKFNNISGIVLSGGFKPGKATLSLLEGIEELPMPILSTPFDTHTSDFIISHIITDVRTDAEDEEKNILIVDLIDEHVDVTKLYSHINIKHELKLTPESFIYRIIKQAKSNRKKIVLPESSEKRILQAAEHVVKRGIADIILLGDKETIEKNANMFSVDIAGMEIVEHLSSKYHKQYANKFYEIRKHKGITPERAADIILDPIYFGTMMVQMGQADALVSGAVHSTADTIRPVLQLIGVKENYSTASSIFFMCLPHKILIYGDCALVENPTAEQLSDIAIMSAETAASFGIDPIIAMLSYSTGESGKGIDVDKMRLATEYARSKRPDLNIDGPIQYDAAISMDVAKIKRKESKVAGRANVYIFPDLNSGNIAYKAVQRSANAIAIGPILQGTKKPVNDLSRGASVEDIIYTIAITAIQAQFV